MLTRANTSNAIALPIEATAVRLKPDRENGRGRRGDEQPAGAPTAEPTAHLRVRPMGTVSLITE